MTAQSREFLRRHDGRLAATDLAAVAGRVRELVAQHEAWRRTCLNMLASENTISRSALALLGSTLATRLTEGFPGDKEFPPPRHNVHIDEIEAILVGLARRLLRARFVEWRATSNTMANAMALRALTAPGDALLVQAMEGGANMSYHAGALPDLLGLRVHSLPPRQDFSVDLDATRAAARAIRPAVIVIGGSYFLFPFPVAELRGIADEVGAAILYDAAHVALHIACGDLQDPLAEGADLVTCGTHKVMSGPIGGLVATNREDIAARILNITYPVFVQTRDQNKYAAAAYALAEMTAFGSAYARQMVSNARALGAALEAEGFTVLGKERGYTMTHQLMLDVRVIGGPLAERVCQESNILVHKSRLIGDGPELTERSGLRLTVQEITRQGMKEGEMERIARLIGRAVLKGEPTARIAAEVEELVAHFQHVHYCFDGPSTREEHAGPC